MGQQDNKTFGCWGVQMPGRVLMWAGHDLQLPGGPHECPALPLAALTPSEWRLAWLRLDSASLQLYVVPGCNEAHTDIWWRWLGLVSRTAAVYLTPYLCVIVQLLLAPRLCLLS
jgi:hypothetical protein